LTHCSERIRYFSLTPLVIRVSLANGAALFETTVCSVADFGWVLRLTSLTGTVHLPQKLARWRFHGDQLSIRRDLTRRSAVRILCERALPEIYQHHQNRLTREDCAMLLLICRSRQESTLLGRLITDVRSFSASSGCS